MLFESELHDASKFVVEVLYPLIKSQPYPINEQILMTCVAKTRDIDYIFEYGTHFGVSARIWYEIKKYFNLKYNIHTIDLPYNEEHIEHPKNNVGVFIRNISEIQQHFGNGVEVSLELAKKFKAKNPLFFVDGDHEYESVYLELDRIYSEFPSSHVLAHDTFMQREEKKYNTGPGRAVKAIIKKYNLEEVQLNIGTPGMTYLYKE